MRFLLLLLGVSFFFIFFLFSQKSLGADSLLPSIFLQANLYIFTSLAFMYFTLKPRSTKSSKQQEEKSIGNLQWTEILFSSFRIFFRDIIYYIAILLFYIGFYLIFGEFFGDLEFSGVLFLFNLLVVALFFLENKISFFSDLLRVNTSVISLYYLIFHGLYIFGYPVNVSVFDIGNIVCIFLLLYLFLYNSSGKNYKNIFYIYIVSFLFLEISAGLKYFFSITMLGYSILAFIFALLTSFFPEKLHSIFKIPLRISRSLTLLFFSLTILLCYFSFGQENAQSFFSILMAGVSAILLFVFHKIFCNYIAGFFASAGVFFVWSQFYFIFMPSPGEMSYIFISYYIFSFFFLLAHKLYFRQYLLDRYFFHILSCLVNLVCVFLFFLFSDFSILLVGLFLLMESVYFASLYYSFKKI